MKKIVLFLLVLFTLNNVYAQINENSTKEFIANGISFKMIFVQGGSFNMGGTVEQGSETDSDEKPVHRVSLDDFYIGQTEVTQELWRAVMGNNPSKYKGNKRPVENVSWDDCQIFIRKLNNITNQKFRLLSEAEWEYAARGGKNSNGFKYAGSNDLNDVAWFWQNSGDDFLWGTDKDFSTDRTVLNNDLHHVVREKSPNELGIYDMSGNVCEWCNDWYDEKYYNDSPLSNPTGPSIGSRCVVRGGFYYGYAKFCRVSKRLSYNPGERFSIIGFRLAM